jgi:hypothetical protein
MPDQIVNVPSSGTTPVAPIDVAQITRADQTLADRQRVVIADPTTADGSAKVDGQLGLQVDLNREIYALLLEQTKLLRAMWLMATMYTGIKVDPDTFPTERG